MYDVKTTFHISLSKVCSTYFDKDGKKGSSTLCIYESQKVTQIFLADRMDENGGKKVMVYLGIHILRLLNLQLLKNISVAGGFLGIRYTY